MAAFLFRTGDGNDGCFPRFFVNLKPSDCPYAALRALLANDYFAGNKVRRFIVRNTEVDGEVEFGLSATVYEGPYGESAYGAAWLCAELNPATTADDGALESGAWRSDGRYSTYELRKVLDRAALRQFRTDNRDFCWPRTMTNAEVARIWATQASPKAASKTLHCAGPDLFSYALRIATIAEGFSLFTTRNPSMTTTKHIRLARRAAIATGLEIGTLP